MVAMEDTNDVDSRPTPLGDPLIQARLERLANRGPGTLPPPVPPTSAPRTSTPGTQTGARPAASRPTRPAARARTNAPTTSRRRHAAKGSRAAALVMSAGTTLGLAAYFQQVDSASASTDGTTMAAAAESTGALVATNTGIATGPATATTAPATVAVPSTAAAAEPQATAVATTTSAVAPNALADGTFVGATFTNRWGPVQVQVTITQGAITEVTALQTPAGDRKSVQINNRAVPKLNSATLTAQSAAIHGVSGATYTSHSYAQSLQSALDAAKAQAA